jgi:hypothetical protein
VITLVTHHNCLDGATCAVLGVAAGMEPAFVYPDGALAYLNGLPEDRRAVLADVSFPLDAYEQVQSRLIQVIDHHQSAWPLRDKPRVLLDLTHCASTLLYGWLTDTGRLQPDPHWLPLLKPVEDYDLWRPDHRVGHDLNRLFHDLGWEWFRDKYAHGFVPLTPSEESRLQELIQVEHAFVARNLARAERFQAGRWHLAVVVLDGEGAVNEVAHSLLTQGLDGVIMIKPDGRLSSRTTDALDAARLMETGFHGGGHPRAAGGRLPADVDPAGDHATHWVKTRTREVLASLDRSD